jgi:precorrin-2/cobalt-factor-2 C20-methyltransferase
VTLGVFYGIGVGPGDPDLITVKGAKLLAACRHIVAPTRKLGSPSLALAIVKPHVRADTVIHEIPFPMTSDKEELRVRWGDSAKKVASLLSTGADVCYLTLGDVFLYSTYIYLIRELRQILPELRVVTTPGVTAFSAAAALAEFPIGEGKETVIVPPTGYDLRETEWALGTGAAVILMKIGDRLARIIEMLRRNGAIDRAVFVSRAGLEGERIETDLSVLEGEAADAGNMSVILVRAKKGGAP